MSTVMEQPEPTWPADPFARALAAEPQLQAIDYTVRVFAANAPRRRTGKPFCSSCVWESIVKPLLSPWVGWERGYPKEQAGDAPPALRTVTLAELIDEPDQEPTPAGTDTEAWLRSSEAYDVVTQRWLDVLDKADPANGHGIHGQFTERVS